MIEHFVSLNISFQLVLHKDSTSRSDWSKIWSCGERIGRRHLVSSAKRNFFEYFIEEDIDHLYR